MAKPNPPTIAPEDIPKRPVDEVDLFLERLYFRLLNQTDHLPSGKINKAWIAFEALSAIFPALEAGLDHEDAKAAYPFPAWRENTVELPVGMVRVIVDGFLEYIEADQKTLGQSYQFEPLNRQGKSPMKKISRKLDRDLKLATHVEIKYRRIGDEPARSLADVVAEVSEEFAVSDATVERAYNKYRKQMDRNIRGLNRRRDITSKTTGSSDMDC